MSFKDDADGAKYKAGCVDKCLATKKAVPEPMGCFKDTWRRDVAKFLCRRCTFDECKLKAVNATLHYISFQHGNECWGDVAIGKFDKKEDTECKMLCAKHKEQNCGGAWRNLIYDLR